MVRYVRTLPSGVRIDANLRVTGLSWDYGPGSESLTITTAPVSSYNAFARWDEAVWDAAAAAWTY